jgi:hypothetical protein
MKRTFKDILTIIVITALTTIIVALAMFISTIAGAIVVYVKLILESEMLIHVAIVTCVITTIVMIVKRVVERMRAQK